MTKHEFQKMFLLFRVVMLRDSDDLFRYSPSAHLIGHCGGYELELHPDLIIWDREIIRLCSLADKLCLSVECRFCDGSIIIR